MNYDDTGQPPCGAEILRFLSRTALRPREVKSCHWLVEIQKESLREGSRRTVQCFLTRRRQFSSWEHRSCAVRLLVLKTLSHRMWRLGSHSFCEDEGLFLAFYAHKGEKGLGRPPVCLKSAPLSGNGSSSSTWEAGNDLFDSVPAR